MSSLTLLLIFLSSSIVSGVAADSALIQTTCKSTKHFDLCVSSLESDPAAKTASDPRGLALIMIAVGVANSTATSAFLNSHTSTKNKSNNNNNAAAMKECAEEYGYAADALRSAAGDLGTEGEGIDYAYVHVSAASDYPNSCRNAFIRRRKNPSLGYSNSYYYPLEIARREEGFKRICDVVLGIMDNIIIGW